jgi:hypothetical protein
MSSPSANAERLQRVQIGNLAAAATEAQLRGLFLVYGKLVSFERPLDLNTGRPGAFVYVEMASSAAVAAIAALNGHVIGGKALTVNASKARIEWVPEIDRHAKSPRPRRTVLPPSERPVIVPATTPPPKRGARQKGHTHESPRAA